MTILFALADHIDHGIIAACAAAGGVAAAHAVRGPKHKKYGMAIVTAIGIGVAIGWISKHLP